MTTKPTTPTPQSKDGIKEVKTVAPNSVPTKQIKPTQLPPHMMNAQRMNGGNRSMQSMKSPRKR
jgi:hypothetical protein